MEQQQAKQELMVLKQNIVKNAKETIESKINQILDISNMQQVIDKIDSDELQELFNSSKFYYKRDVANMLEVKIYFPKTIWAEKEYSWFTIYTDCDCCGIELNLNDPIQDAYPVWQTYENQISILDKPERKYGEFYYPIYQWHCPKFVRDKYIEFGDFYNNKILKEWSDEVITELQEYWEGFSINSKRKSIIDLATKYITNQLESFDYIKKVKLISDYSEWDKGSVLEFIFEYNYK